MNIYESIKGLVTPQRVAKAAATLGEKETDVSSAIGYIIPSLLGALYTKGATPAIKDTVQLAGKNRLLTDLDSIYEGSGVIDGMNLGERFENALIGVHNQEFPKSIARASGIKYENADRLTNWVASTIAAWFGDMTVVNKHSLTGLIQQLGSEKSQFSKDIPEGVACELNLLVPGACVREEDKKRSNRWIWWLVIILIVLILAFLIFRSCGNRSTDRNTAATSRQTENVSAARGNDNASTRDNGNKRITLPDGNSIRIASGSTEDQMISFLNSDEFTRSGSGSTAQASKWFHFDDIDFVHDSATEMTSGSKTQLDNIATILKAYPNAKITVGGYADRTGTRAVNHEISQERADYVKKVFADSGLNSSRISTEAFGKSLAQQPASASDSERAIDRSVALRLDKVAN